ncbi:MAG: DUF748 domain-containing protein [Candidatus Omnitrophica bacterium]|nr:DUF748 domain-containing protein [Candidatus Omnitrophota bacterium]MBU4488800.1 DUF748 domain-containing protein [Candidatus Omnitrophota bacterium]MCG2705457.1 DUF748 domain-containing protein [Candidatus Omnitrophota bacterium]
MAKKILIVLVLLIVLLGASLYFFRDALKQYTLNLILKSFPIPNVALAGINFDETTGKLHLEDIKVKNPKGFQGKYLMEASSVDMKLNVTTKPSLRLDINNIQIQNPTFYVERSAADRWNFQEFDKKDAKNKPSASIKNKDYFGFVKDAFAENAAAEPKISLPGTINIKNGVIHYLDSFISPGQGHHIDIFPLTGIVSLTRSADEKNYEKIAFNGFANLNGKSERVIKGNFEISPMREEPTYSWQFTASEIPLANLKPYLDKYAPFIVTQGVFSVNSDLKAVDGAIDGNYTMEITDLVFYLNPEKSSSPFLETSVQKLTMYLTNQRGNVVIDFKQKTDSKGNVRWGLGPIAKRAVGMMAIDTVIDIIQKTQGSDTTDIIRQNLPKNIPPEVIDIFKEIIR